MRSFAAPVALAFVGCVIAFGLMLRQSIVSYAVPQGILNRTLMLGSSALDYAGDLTLSSFLPIMVAITVTGAVLWGLLALVSRRTGARASRSAQCTRQRRWGRTFPAKTAFSRR